MLQVIQRRKDAAESVCGHSLNVIKKIKKRLYVWDDSNFSLICRPSNTWRLLPESILKRVCKHWSLILYWKPYCSEVNDVILLCGQPLLCRSVHCRPSDSIWEFSTPKLLAVFSLLAQNQTRRQSTALAENIYDVAIATCWLVVLKITAGYRLS